MKGRGPAERGERQNIQPDLSPSYIRIWTAGYTWAVIPTRTRMRPKSSVYFDRREIVSCLRQDLQRRSGSSVGALAVAGVAGCHDSAQLPPGEGDVG